MFHTSKAETMKPSVPYRLAVPADAKVGHSGRAGEGEHLVVRPAAHTWGERGAPVIHIPGGVQQYSTLSHS